MATITLNRPERRNALSDVVLCEILAALEAAGADPAVRVVVFTGAGDKAFSAGADLAPPSGDGFLAGHDRRGLFPQVFQAFSSLRKPTIARVQGHALAGGLGLVLACDFAVAADDVTLGTPEVHRGLMPYMVLALLRRHVGRKKALELMLLGERLSAAEAADIGILNRVVPRAALDAAVAELAGKLASKSAAILALGKNAFYRTEDMALGDALEYMRSQLSLNTLAEDAAEGVMAFVEKREPAWKDR